jgi:hypothetical protein
MWTILVATGPTGDAPSAPVNRLGEPVDHNIAEVGEDAERNIDQKSLHGHISTRC